MMKGMSGKRDLAELRHLSGDAFRSRLREHLRRMRTLMEMEGHDAADGLPVTSNDWSARRSESMTTRAPELARKGQWSDVDLLLEYDRRPPFPDFVTATVSIPLRLQQGSKHNRESAANARA